LASRKLNLHAGPQSPILAVFWLASWHTGVDATKILGADRITKAFHNVHAVVTPGQADRYISEASQPYHAALGALKDSIDAAAGMRTVDPVTVTTTLNNARDARSAIRQISAKFNIDNEARIDEKVMKLLDEPITYADVLVRDLEPRDLNTRGSGLC
jgi:hypothetical protein